MNEMIQQEEKGFSFWFLFLCCLLLTLQSGVSFAQTGVSVPPEQPAEGLGGKEYRHAGFKVSTFGEGELKFWLFEPADPPTEQAPLVVFLHGWGGIDPKTYGAWIRHLVRRGAVVVYPSYQTGWRYPPAKINDNAIQATKNALAELKRAGHVRIRDDQFAIVGHSAGGMIAASMASLALENGLPKPAAVMSVEPGKSWTKMKRAVIPLAALSSIPPETILVTIAGDQDKVVQDRDAKKILSEATAVPAERKFFVELTSDDHGQPPLKANHFAPCGIDPVFSASIKELQPVEENPDRGRGGDDLPNISRGESSINALDYYGLWKLFDAMLATIQSRKGLVFSPANDSRLRFMGTWSDGVPVKELKFYDNP